MLYIAHRINTVEELRNVPERYGVEVDIRDADGRLVLQHDPFKPGQEFSEYLKHFCHAFLIANIKSERVEERVLEEIRRHNISRFFLLDCSFPMVYMLSKRGERNIAVRYSEFEGIDTVLAMKGKINWVWVDGFTCLPLDKTSFDQIKSSQYRICLVSPDLQGRAEEIENYQKHLSKEGIIIDAVCAKLSAIPQWEKYFLPS